MNRRTTLVLATIFVVILAYVGLFEAKGPTTRERGEQAGRVLGRLDPSKVDALLISKGEEKVELRRETLPVSGPKDPELPGAPPTRWRMLTPVADRADGAVLDALLADLEGYRRDGTVPVPGANADAAKLAPYGLQNPRLRLKIIPKTGDKDAPPESELRFGNDTPVQGRVFVQVAGREEVYAAPDNLRKQLERGAGEFRDHRFTDLGNAEIGRLTIKNAAGASLELAREGGDHWKMVKPQAARAGDQRLDELVNRLTELRLSRFVAADDKTAAGALAEPRGTLTVATADTPSRTAELLVGKPVEAPPPPATPASGAAPSDPPPAGGELYASSAGRPGVLVVPRTVEEFFNLKPEDLRDRQLARVNPDSVDRVRIQPSGGATAAPAFTLSRVRGGQAKAWTLREGTAPNAPERPANGAEVERLLTRLPTQTVAGFVADTAGDLPKYGLDQPTLRVSYLAVASEPTAEGGAGEKPVATVVFGKADGANVFARLEEEPFIVSVPRSTLDAVPAEPVAWQSPEIFAGDPDRVRTVGVTRRGQPEVVLERAAGGTDAKGWKVVVPGGTGGAPDAVQAATVANTLARLRAVRWVGGTRPEHGLDQPEASLAFTTTEPGQPGGKVLVGARAPEGGWFARVEGRPGTFLLNAPDHETLLRPLVTDPAAAPGPPGAPAAVPTP